MRSPSTQARILAFAPIQLVAWGSALFFGYHFFNGEPVFWPLVITVTFLLNVVRADEQVQACRSWKRQWDAMAGIPPRAKGRPNFLVVMLGAPFIYLLYHVGQQGGASALLGVALLIIGPLLVIGLALKLIGRMIRRKAAKVMPVSVCVNRSWLPAPDITRAYRGLPAYCRAILRTTP